MLRFTPNFHTALQTEQTNKLRLVDQFGAFSALTCLSFAAVSPFYFCAHRGAHSVSGNLSYTQANITLYYLPFNRSYKGEKFMSAKFTPSLPVP